jgi:RNA polymerase sigma-70 factor (ECF subfamily)
MNDETETAGERAQELALVRAISQGERGAFDKLYALHHERIWAFLLRLTGRKDEAEDLFQETWLAAAKAASQLQAESRLLPWLFTIARNKHRSARRFLLFDLRKRALQALEPLPEAENAEAHVLGAEEAEALQRAFYALPDASREVLLLSLEGFDAPHIAGVLGLREDAVRKRLSRARTELRELIESQAAHPRALSTRKSS